jgi:hypothetical protein
MCIEAVNDRYPDRILKEETVKGIIKLISQELKYQIELWEKTVLGDGNSWGLLEDFLSYQNKPYYLCVEDIISGEFTILLK